MAKVNAFNPRVKALQKIGLDESQLVEIPPVNFHGYDFDSPGTRTKIGKDGRLRSSKYESTWLFFSSTQVFMYKISLDMLSESKHERTEEYFYRDITNFSTQSKTIDSERIVGCFGNKKRETAEYTSFCLIVPGAEFSCSLSGVHNADAAINAMKHKLREKKS